MRDGENCEMRDSSIDGAKNPSTNQKCTRVPTTKIHRAASNSTYANRAMSPPALETAHKTSEMYTRAGGYRLKRIIREHA